MTRTRIAIVGVGPRGLSVFERILSHTIGARSSVDVLLIEPAELGVGVHAHDQPAYLILNTVAGQATTFSDRDMVPGRPTIGGPNFLTWCRAHHVPRPGDMHDGSQAGPVESGDFLPRRLFGEYLSWSARWLLDRIPANVSVTVIPQIATAVQPASDGKATVLLADGVIHVVDLAFVTTGHGIVRRSPTVQSSSARLISSPYPLPETVAAIPPDGRVGLAGTGLTAIDIIAALTVGRGGRFCWGESPVSYEASGQEPQIVVYNRTGWLPSARPRHPRRIPKARARYLTKEALTDLRAARPGGHLDFESDLMPLIRREILAPDLTARECLSATRMLALQPEYFVTGDRYREETVEQAKWDLHEAQLGLVLSRYKDAMEALRDHRETLRSALEGGLTAEGHVDFFRLLPPLANRTAVGPQIERLLEILALIDIGVVRLGPGPSPTPHREGTGWVLSSTHLERQEHVYVDWLVEAHIEWPKSEGPDDPVASGLTSWAAARPDSAVYLDLTAYGAVRTRGGDVINAIVVIGPPAEGSSYYNNYVLWPGAWSRALSDIDHALGRYLTT